ncbi:uncharacterized protein LOC122112511 isoform X1 [Dipodomys spectabilis]|uniref:uncharacterized protein LOC122112511 isoform X1 n=1 Tax=Dipodomys spectabilis TaxID=105255 RepID=UPI001C5373D6|nr:uncharacterized protein LOC122112511 isoform X1 [Dipodomys spectabilis]XP_042541244.1 uncharacterized protein LOC122112511 isoform X1 [Dipodomys spectabilis]XP_042541245.1 uncharacterized protein LOC122112511 isoform X1 [Dipodomys spectabilis]
MIRSFCRSVYYWFVFIRRHNRVVHATTDTRTYPETEKTDDNILTEVVISSNENDITCPEKTEPQEIISKHVNKSDTDLLDIVISSGNNTTTGDSDTVLAVVNNTTGLEDTKTGDLILEDISDSDTDTIPDIVIGSGNFMTTGVNTSEVPHVGTTSQSVKPSEVSHIGSENISTYELRSFPEGRRTSSEWALELSALNKSVDLSEVLPVPLLGILTDEPCPYEICKGRERTFQNTTRAVLSFCASTPR